MEVITNLREKKKSKDDKHERMNVNIKQKTKALKKKWTRVGVKTRKEREGGERKRGGGGGYRGGGGGGDGPQRGVITQRPTNHNIVYIPK